MLIFTERSIDKWKNLRENDSKFITPQVGRKFDLKDAVAYPMLKPINTGLKPDANNAMIQHGDSKILISKDGKFKIENGNEDVLTIIKDLCTACESILTNTFLGPQPPVNKADFTSLKNRIGGMII